MGDATGMNRCSQTEVGGFSVIDVSLRSLNEKQELLCPATISRDNPKFFSFHMLTCVTVKKMVGALRGHGPRPMLFGPDKRATQ